MKDIIEKIGNILINIGLDLLKIVIILIVAQVCIAIVSRITKKTMEKAEKLDDKEKAKQIKTSMTVTHSANRYAVYAIAIFLCLKEVGLGEGLTSAAIIAGAGGLIISLGAQSIVKDMVAGLFLMFEKQYFVGDHVKIGEYEGNVTSIALRVTYLECAGKRVIIPNGEIKEVINYSRTNSLAIVNIPIAYENDVNKIVDILTNVANKYYEDNKDLFVDEKPNINAITSFEANYYNVSIVVKTKPLNHWKVERDLRLLVKQEFDKKKIQIPHQEITIKNK